MMKGIVTAAGAALGAASTAFAPPADATSRQVRVSGAITVGIGACCFAVGGLVLMFLQHQPQWMKAAFLPIVAGYAFFLVGGYRLAFGKSAKAGLYETTSFKRIAFGVLWMVFIFGVLIGGIWLFAPA